MSSKLTAAHYKTEPGNVNTALSGLTRCATHHTNGTETDEAYGEGTVGCLQRRRDLLVNARASGDKRAVGIRLPRQDGRDLRVLQRLHCGEHAGREDVREEEEGAVRESREVWRRAGGP